MNDFSITDVRDKFSHAAKEWVCDFYHVQFRYIAKKTSGDLEIVHALVLFHPWMSEGQDVGQFNFHIEAGEFEVGQTVLPSVVLPQAIRSLDDALNGEIDLPGVKMKLARGGAVLHYLRGATKDPWVNMIHMSVSALGSEQHQIPATLDDDLRRADVPFDGYSDVLQWLSLNEFAHPAGVPSLAIAVHPPAKIVVESGSLANGKLNVVVDVMSSVDCTTVAVAAMGSPPAGVSLRRQLREHMTWQPASGTQTIRGTATVNLQNAHLALIALSIGNTYVQRHWYRDPTLSKNVRFAAAQEFDHDLTKIKERLKSTDSRTFEKAVAALMFLSGFAPLLPLEDAGPDIIGVTPGGQVVLVECTVKTTDAIKKIGNLVSRREALRDAFLRGNHNNSIMTVLVCQTPRSHIPTQDAELADHDVLLITREGIDRQVGRVQSPVDADELCVNGSELLRRLKSRVAQ